jgi:hypothetical protein
MFHLVDESLSSRIEGNLIHARRINDSWFSMGFNMISLVLVVGSFIYFLYSSYNPNPVVENKHIEYKPVPWLNAVRNVPGDQQYGQVPETEIGSSVQGFAYRSSTSTF